MSKTGISAQVFTDYDKFEAGPPGSVTFARNKDGHLAAMMIKCPGCGKKSSMCLRYPGRPKQPGASWDLQSHDPVSVYPSVNHTVQKGGCGWHGWLQDGIWRI